MRKFLLVTILSLTFVGSENVVLSMMATCTTLWLLSIFLHDLGDGELSLDALSEKYDVTRKRKDLTQDYLKNGKTFYDIPYEIVEEYGIADVKATEEVAIKQLIAFGTTFEELYDTNY